jgi:hypothetical protein
LTRVKTALFAPIAEARTLGLAEGFAYQLAASFEDRGEGRGIRRIRHPFARGEHEKCSENRFGRIPEGDGDDQHAEQQYRYAVGRQTVTQKRLLRSDFLFLRLPEEVLCSGFAMRFSSTAGPSEIAARDWTTC